MQTISYRKERPPYLEWPKLGFIMKFNTSQRQHWLVKNPSSIHAILFPPLNPFLPLSSSILESISTDFLHPCRRALMKSVEFGTGKEGVSPTGFWCEMGATAVFLMLRLQSLLSNEGKRSRLDSKLQMISINHHRTDQSRTYVTFQNMQYIRMHWWRKVTLKREKQAQPN